MCKYLWSDITEWSPWITTIKPSCARIFDVSEWILHYTFLLYRLRAVERHRHSVNIFFQLENDCLLLLNIFYQPLKAPQQGINFRQTKTRKMASSFQMQLTNNGIQWNCETSWRRGIRRKIVNVLQRTWLDLTWLFWTERSWFTALQRNYSDIYSEIVDSDRTYEDFGTTEITRARQGLII